MVYIIFTIVFLVFVLYLFYQTKIKNNKNYPVALAMSLGFLIILLNKNIAWIIESVNKMFNFTFTIPKPIPTLEIALFFLFLYGLTGLYYKFVFTSTAQKNSIFSFFIKGNIEQKNESNK